MVSSPVMVNTGAVQCVQFVMGVYVVHQRLDHDFPTG